MTTNLKTRLMIAACAKVLLLVGACGQREGVAEPGANVQAEGEAGMQFERGTHNGRILRDGDLSLEVTIFEIGASPQFRVFPYFKGAPIDPDAVSLTVELQRLGGKTSTFMFTPEADYLVGDATVEEPHSFDVTVRATLNGRNHDWQYESYEGRTIIAAASAATAGVEVTPAGPGMISNTLELTGRIVLDPSARAEVRAVYSGAVKSASKSVGERVRKGETLARIESAQSLQTYSVVSPIDGVVLERNTNVGNVTGDQPIYIIGDLSHLQAELHVFPGDQQRVKPGQAATISNIGEGATLETRIESFLPTAEVMTQTLVARAPFSDASGVFRPGMTVRGALVISQREAPLVVKNEALQRFRDFTVVFAQVGETYEVRMLALGDSDSKNTEVLGGLEPGETYVSKNAFLIKADIEKSGASHDH